VSKARLVITAVVVEGRPVAEVAIAYGVSRQWIYKLLARYRAEGEAAFQPRSRRPSSLPTAIPAATVELIIQLRRQLAGQGLDAGAHTIAWHLAEQHQLRVSVATIWRTLQRAGLISPEPKKKPKASFVRFAAEQPNQMWQTDFTHYRLTCSDGTPGADVEILTFIDDHSRYAVSVTCHQPVTGPQSSPPSGKRSLTRAFPPQCCPTTAWSTPPASPAAAPAETPSTASKPNWLTWAWRRNTPNRTTPPPAAKSNASSKH
jgi:transposase